jgi:hypothetical protein
MLKGRSLSNWLEGDGAVMKVEFEVDGLGWRFSY